MSRPETKLQTMLNTRNTMTADLKAGRRVVYRGTTSDPAAREAAHRADRMVFDRLIPTSRRMTQEGAKAKEKAQLAAYRGSHDGRNPNYTRDSDG